MNLQQKVAVARAIYGTRNTNRAGKLLLGKAEQAELIAEAKGWGFYKDEDRMLEKTGDCRVEYVGLKVYSVDDESYCEVAP